MCSAPTGKTGKSGGAEGRGHGALSAALSRPALARALPWRRYRLGVGLGLGAVPPGRQWRHLGAGGLALHPLVVLVILLLQRLDVTRSRLTHSCTKAVAAACSAPRGAPWASSLVSASLAGPQREDQRPAEHPILCLHRLWESWWSSLSPQAVCPAACVSTRKGHTACGAALGTSNSPGRETSKGALGRPMAGALEPSKEALYKQQ